MSSVSIKVNPTILNWLMQEAQQGNVGSSIIDLIKEWISGEKEPTFSQIETVSKKISIPFGYFFLENIRVRGFIGNLKIKIIWF